MTTITEIGIPEFVVRALVEDEVLVINAQLPQARRGQTAQFALHLENTYLEKRGFRVHLDLTSLLVEIVLKKIPMSSQSRNQQGRKSLAKKRVEVLLVINRYLHGFRVEGY